jgi:tetratricopeptide (TPR) repeat protein
MHSFHVSGLGGTGKDVVPAETSSSEGMNILKHWKGTPEELDTAEKLFQKALAFDPDKAEALTGRGMVLLRREWISDRDIDHEALLKALDLAERSMVIDHKRIATHMLKGMTLTYLGRYEDALRVVANIKDLDESSCEHLHLQAGIYELQGKTDDAIAVFTRELLCPGLDAARKENLYDILGGLYFGKKDYDNAIRSLQKAIALNPESAKTYSTYSMVLLAKGELEEAEKMANKALSIMDNKVFHNNLAWIYLEKGERFHKENKFVEAEQHYFRALAENPQLKVAYDRLIYLYGKMGNCERASKVAMDVLNRYPEDPYAKQVIDYCNKKQIWGSGMQ